MNFGLISDIHANLPALETVLSELDAHGAERIFNAGDLVCYGPFPNEVIELLRSREIISIYGNRDKEICEFPQNKAQYQANLHPLKFRAYEWTCDNLATENLKYLRSLPERASISLVSHRLLMVHDKVFPEISQLRPDTPDCKYEEVGPRVEEDIIIFGHTHIPFVKQIAEKLFVNTGSVGRPGDGDPRAGYALLSIDGGNIEVQIKRVKYNLDRTLKAVYESALPDEFALIFIEGRKLDDIIKIQEARSKNQDSVTER